MDENRQRGDPADAGKPCRWTLVLTAARGSQTPRVVAAMAELCRIVPLEGLEPETRYRQEPADTQTPERLFEQQWALTLLDQGWPDSKPK